ncbi:putative nonaspanin (TM9SF) [Helianthus annuus]|nr:putative nonaspanin (TM9SF) [Helianthus annuus]
MFHMQEELPCQVVCRVKLDAKSAKSFRDMIDDEYRVNMILDNLPVAVLRQRLYGSQSTVYEHGFRVGFKGSYAGVSSIYEKNQKIHVTDLIFFF